MSSNRFNTLDAMRGIAAIAVMLYHTRPANVLPAATGYLAVDLFFCLSGFVLASAYQDVLREGMSFASFMKRRLQRFLPMLLVGSVFAVALAGASPPIALLVPDPGSEFLFPANQAFWSLLFELAVNAAYAAVAFRLSRNGLLGVLAVSGIAICLFLASGTYLNRSGAMWAELPAGIARTIFDFTMGVFLARTMRDEGRRLTTTVWGWLPCLAVGALLIMPTRSGMIIDLVAMFIFVPAMVWLGARWQMPDANLPALLGGLSYPLYCIHMPIIRATENAELRVLLGLACIALALALDRWVDGPLQRSFKQRRISQPAGLAPA